MIREGEKFPMESWSSWGFQLILKTEPRDVRSKRLASARLVNLLVRLVVQILPVVSG